MSTDRSFAWAKVAAATSAGAALVHAAAAGTHGDTQQLVRLFTLTAAAQGAVAITLLITRARWAAATTIVVNGAAVAAWAMSRTIGIRAVDALVEREPIGTQDLTAAVLATAAMLAGAMALRAAGSTRAATWPAWLPGAAMVLAVVPAIVGVAAPHAHDDHVDDHGHGGTGLAAAPVTPEHHDVGSAATHDHDDDSDAAGLAADPKLTGADTSHASTEELTAALDLIDATRTGETVTTITTTEQAEAAGYVWIGDGRRSGGFQHYIHPGYLADGTTLDPDAVESLVFENTDAGPLLVSAMYVLDVGATMDDVPEVAGDLTVWHDHQNLCWDESGQRLAGVLVAGRCRPGGELRPTPPMLHVWLSEHECGPFAGIEGHGSSCAHEH